VVIIFVVAGFAVILARFLVGDGNTEFVRAWRIWTDGRSAQPEPLWGHTVLWWARTGKLLQFAAGLVVILDLVGPVRLRNAGTGATQRLGAVREHFLRWRRMPERTLNSAIQMAVGMLLFSFSLLFLTLLVMNWSQAARSVWTLLLFLVAPIALVVFVVVGGPEKSAGARLPLAGFGWLVTWLLLGLPAAILDKANPGHVLRWLGLTLFVAGFALDLLGS
jgi:hypothetical protein